jgi:hypothetical protein
MGKVNKQVLQACGGSSFFDLFLARQTSFRQCFFMFYESEFCVTGFRTKFQVMCSFFFQIFILFSNVA